MSTSLEETNKPRTISGFHVLPCAAVGPGHILAERHFVILLTTVVFTLPLSLYRNIERLGKVRWTVARLHLSSGRCLLKNIPVCHQVSFLSMVLTFFILIVVVIRAATLGPQMYG